MRLDPRVPKTAYALAHYSALPAAFVMCVTSAEAIQNWTGLMGMTFSTVPFEQDFEGACVLTLGLVIGWAASDIWRALCWIWRDR